MTEIENVDEPWLPRESIYLDRTDEPHLRPARPYCQGDVFLDVPIPVAKRNADEPTINTGPAILLGHPCNIHQGPRVSAIQLVAAVRPLPEAVGERSFEAPWVSHFFLFPLPDLLAGEDFVADFRRVGTTHYKNLEGKRVACLTHDGWAALQRRLAYHTLRADIPLESRAADLTGSWNEMRLWEEWNTRGNDSEDFLTWLNASQEAGAYAGTRRDDLLDLGFDELISELPQARS